MHLEAEGHSFSRIVWLREEELIAPCSLCALTERASSLHWLNWGKFNVKIFPSYRASVDAVVSRKKKKATKNTGGKNNTRRQVVVLCGFSSVCSVATPPPTPHPPCSLLPPASFGLSLHQDLQDCFGIIPKILSHPFSLVLADWILHAETDASEMVFSPL